MSATNRIKKLEQNIQADGRTFIGWADNPWTHDREKEAMRRHPQRKVFMRSLLETPEETQRKMSDRGAGL